ncbi:MAG: NAD-dependent epimerase/dehydratase family protein [Gemmataceae bacterium]|nr:NAD-dependent epimerase/dehydratase family protein [Gemmataceae bacterium]
MDRIENTDHLEDLLSEPAPHAIETLARLDGDLMLLGVAGKMGPTLARMARRASDQAGVPRRIVGVARFSDPHIEGQLQSLGIDTIRCDLLDQAQLEQLPDVPNVIAMFGMKFGSTGQEARTWAMNCLAPALVCQKFRKSRIVAFSTGNVYGLTPVAGGGSRESDPLNAGGDYAMSCVGRERIYEYCSRTLAIPMAILRLNYAVEMRYGVLVDIAQRVWVELPVDLSMGYLNAIWQADANAAALSAFAQLATPPRVFNIAGPEVLSVRRVAEEFASRFGKPVKLEGVESADALLSNAEESHRLFGLPRISAAQMIAWIADWTARGGATLGKPTHFEIRDGKY